MFDDLSKYLKKEEFRISILNGKIHILNYKKIIDITDFELIINIGSYTIKIEGKNLILVKLDKKELLIKGIVKKVNIDE